MEEIKQLIEAALLDIQCCGNCDSWEPSKDGGWCEIFRSDREGNNVCRDNWTKDEFFFEKRISYSVLG